MKATTASDTADDPLVCRPLSRVLSGSECSMNAEGFLHVATSLASSVCGAAGKAGLLHHVFNLMDRKTQGQQQCPHSWCER